MSQQFPLLFSPFQLGKKTLRSRIVFTGHVTGFSENRLPSETHIYYHRERARGGVGMIVMESEVVHPTGYIYFTLNYDDRIIPWYQRISSAVHDEGTVILNQLTHVGRKASKGNLRIGKELSYPVAPSAVPAPTPDRSQTMPHELEIEEIEELVECFGQAARRGREGGLDGSEIVMGMGNLIPQFLCAQSNQRTDKYGGSLENRMRFPIEVIEAVRRNLGDDLILGVRISEDFLDYSLSFEDIKEIAPLLEATGKLNYINVQAGAAYEWKSGGTQIPPFYYPPGSFVYLAAGVRELVSLPIIGAGRLNSPEIAEKVLADGHADLVGMVRELIADPHLPAKARQGRLDDIRTCVACNQGCIGHVEADLPLTCIYNPVTSREREWAELSPAQTKKNVVVVGGGPAGLEAARVAAERGHKVTLLEKKDRLGDQVELVAKTPKREDFAEIARFFRGQLKKLGVEVKLGVEATAEMVLETNPDAVVVATGTRPYVPPISGVEGKNVVTVWDVLEDRCEIGEKVVIVDTQGLPAGSFTADYLAERGKKVRIATELPYVGMEMVKPVWRLLYERLLHKGVEMIPFTRVKEIREDSLLVANTMTGVERVMEEVDTVVLAAGGIANNELYRSLKGKVKELHAIGDCVAPRDVEAAVYEGHKVGRML